MRIAMFSWETLHSHAVGGIAAHLRGELEQRARQLGVAHATRFVGYQNGWTLIDLYKACDAGCLPSRNEPFGISALEGWAAGKPVVASRNGGPSEFIWPNVTGLKTDATTASVGSRAVERSAPPNGTSSRRTSTTCRATLRSSRLTRPWRTTA